MSIEPMTRYRVNRILCAHADQNGEGAHWKSEGERCPLSAPFLPLERIPVGALVRHDIHTGELMSNQDMHGGGYRRFEINCRCGCDWYIGSTVGTNELQVLDLGPGSGS